MALGSQRDCSAQPKEPLKIQGAGGIRTHDFMLLQSIALDRSATAPNILGKLWC